MLLPTTLDSLLSSGIFLLRFFKQVQNDVDLCGRRLRRLNGLEHQEALAIGSQASPLKIKAGLFLGSYGTGIR